LVLSLFIMGTTLLAVKERGHPVQVAGANFWTSEWDSKSLEPYRQFLKKNSEQKEANYFRNLIKRTWPEYIKRKIKPDSLLILIPAFTVSQLTQAFRIGLLIYLPFLSID
ncbi:EscR/YscR/HrcR family type III secretion system export apparatus protein, partial [Salmonella enterica subsp. enterica serovar Oslo]|nr:EscR/YscR/HrcR family type III secretion system export apparatus protein [Salmonella enterica subsp. enterica serovar Oslo]